MHLSYNAFQVVKAVILVDSSAIFLASPLSISVLFRDPIDSSHFPPIRRHVFSAYLLDVTFGSVKLRRPERILRLENFVAVQHSVNLSPMALLNLIKTPK